jgi:hypothetical protein
MAAQARVAEHLAAHGVALNIERRERRLLRAQVTRRQQYQHGA